MTHQAQGARPPGTAAPVGPCVRCERPCTLNPDGRRRLCDDCDVIADQIIADVLARRASASAARAAP